MLCYLVFTQCIIYMSLHLFSFQDLNDQTYADLKKFHNEIFVILKYTSSKILLLREFHVQCFFPPFKIFFILKINTWLSQTCACKNNYCFM